MLFLQKINWKSSLILLRETLHVFQMEDWRVGRVKNTTFCLKSIKIILEARNLNRKKEIYLALRNIHFGTQLLKVWLTPIFSKRKCYF